MALKNRDKLLVDLASWMERYENMEQHAQLSALEVTLYDGDGKALRSGSLAWALDVLANNLFWDAEADWRDAQSLGVRTI